MARAQNPTRGRFTKKATVVPVGGGIIFSSYSTSANLLTGNSTGLKVANRTNAVLNGNSTGLTVKGGIKLSGAQTIAGNSTGFLFSNRTTLPAVRSTTHKWCFIKTAGGTGAIAVNTTGASWKYAQVTSKFNTTSGYA